MERTICVSKDDAMLKSRSIVANAGATMDEDMGEIDISSEVKMVSLQRLALVQFWGLSGSSGLSMRAVS